jgi:hypothetical protein
LPNHVFAKRFSHDPPVAMLSHHLVRIGLLGHVGRFRAADARCYPRGVRVVVRTARGLEVGEILAAPTAYDDESQSGDAADRGSVSVGANVTIGGNARIADAIENTEPVAGDGAILRGMTVEDELLEARLLRHRDRAFEACQRQLAERNISAALIDVEHLFDGRGLYFYFLGQPPAEAEQITAELAATYDAHVEFRQFADTLAYGCGPDCGSEAAGGGGCGSCGTGCAIAGACRPKATSIADSN